MAKKNENQLLSFVRLVLCLTQVCFVERFKEKRKDRLKRHFFIFSFGHPNVVGDITLSWKKKGN